MYGIWIGPTDIPILARDKVHIQLPVCYLALTLTYFIFSLCVCVWCVLCTCRVFFLSAYPFRWAASRQTCSKSGIHFPWEFSRYVYTGRVCWCSLAGIVTSAVFKLGSRTDRYFHYFWFFFNAMNEKQC